MKREFVLASSNPGKLRELTGMFEPLGLVVRPQADWQVPDAAETAVTFVENSLLKARQAAKYTGLPSIADDSGLVVPALGGEPGIYSARYSGANADSQANMRKLLDNLRGKAGADRNAHFYCAMVLVNTAADPAPLVATGRWHGRILNAPRGEGGFGYDPIFGIFSSAEREPRRSAAELTAIEKSRLSHRGQALRELVRQLRQSGDSASANGPW